jgi:uncharacterized protein (DUF433 family)
MSKTTLIPLHPLDVTQYLDVQAPDDIRIQGHRIGIEHIVYYYNEGYSPEQIADTFPGVELKVIYTIIAYYLHYRSEVDAYIAHLDAEAEAARRNWTAHRSPESLRVEAILKKHR